MVSAMVLFLFFLCCFFLIAHRTFTPGKQRYDRKEGNKLKSMPRGSPCLIAEMPQDLLMGATQTRLKGGWKKEWNESTV